MYALAQCWMQQGIFGSFRQSSGAVAADQQQQQASELDLAPWFDSLLVRLVILVSEGQVAEWLWHWSSWRRQPLVPLRLQHSRWFEPWAKHIASGQLQCRQHQHLTVAWLRVVFTT